MSELKKLLDSYRLASVTEREKGFIRTTEAINYEDLIAYNSKQETKEARKMHLLLESSGSKIQ